MNKDCNRISSETSKLVVSGDAHLEGPHLLDLPYKGSKVMLKINQTWIVSHINLEINQAHREILMNEYLCSDDKFGWSEKVYDSVSWKTIKTVHSAQSQSGLQQTCKILNGDFQLGICKCISQDTRNVLDSNVKMKQSIT